MANPKSKQHSEKFSGKIVQFIYSPKGGIEGLLLEDPNGTLQLSIASEFGGILAQGMSLGDTVNGELGNHLKPHSNSGSNHRVHELVAIDLGKKPLLKLMLKNGPQELEGVVKAFNFAKHGEPNGVILMSGDFIHLRPDGLKRSKVKIGDQVTARGQARISVLGTIAFEAQSINGINLEP
jgi:hypothetical protein